MALGVIWADGLWNEAIWNNAIWSQAAALNPNVTTSVVITNGDELQINFDRPVDFGAGGNGGFTVTMSGGAATLTYDRGATTSVLVYDISRTIDAEETGTLDYTQPGDGVENPSTGEDLLTFASFEITIGSEASFNDPSLVHKETSLSHGDRNLRHNRINTEHND